MVPSTCKRTVVRLKVKVRLVSQRPNLHKASVDVDELNSTVPLDVVCHQLIHSRIPRPQRTVGRPSRKKSLESATIETESSLVSSDIDVPKGQGMLGAACF